MYYVYMLRSRPKPDQTYIGLTDDLKKRIQKHNEGGSPHTSSYKPWQLVTIWHFQPASKLLTLKHILSPVPAGPLQRNGYGNDSLSGAVVLIEQPLPFSGESPLLKIA